MADTWRSEGPLTLQAKLLRLNWLALLLVSAIAALGAVMLYSVAGGSLDPWAGPHLWRFGFGLAVMVIIAVVDIKVWLRFAYAIYGGILALLVLVPLVGTRAMGAQRWLEVGGLHVQPSEFMKIALVLMLAAYFHNRDDAKISRPDYLLVPLLLISVPAVMIAQQPDLGTSGLVLVGGLAVLFLAGVHWAYFAAGGIASLAALPLMWHMMRGYQRERVLTFLDPERDPLGAGYHILQSKIAVGSGGLDGKGLLSGTQSQLNFLPEKHTDFIFTTLAEELGLVGASGLLALYALLFMFGIYVAWRSTSRFGQLLAAGVSFTVFLYVVINVAMVTGLVPVVGVPLPLVSYGGTAMLTVMAGLGLVLNVSIHRHVELERGSGPALAWPPWPVKG
jgi:rod shape determining protein RodA